MNKWDLAAEAARQATRAMPPPPRAERNAGPMRNTNSMMWIRASCFRLRKMVRGKLKFLSYAPIVFLSAKTGERAQKLFPLIDEVALARKRRIATPELNRWLKEEVDLQRGSTPKARPVRIYYITQAKHRRRLFLSSPTRRRAAFQFRALSGKSAARQVRF